MDRRLHIAYFLSVSNDYVGGADHTLFMQAVLMNARHEVMVVLPCDAGGKYNTLFQRKCEAFGLDYIVLKYNTANSIKTVNMINVLKDIDRIEKFVKEKQIDILHSVQINLAVEYLSRKLGIPHIMNIYNLAAWEWKIPCADVFPCYVSSDSLFYFEKWKTYLNGKGSCVRVFDDIGLRKKRLSNKDITIIGTAGTIGNRKNQMEVIKAVEIEKKRGRNLRLLLAGDAGSIYAEECRSYVEEHGLWENIEFMGFLDDMTIFFEQIDVYICGSIMESFPASIVEAISCNIPVISTPVAGVPEILKHRQNAYLSRGYLAEELAEALDEYLEDDFSGRIENVLLRERESYEKFFSAAAVSSQLNALYNEVFEDFDRTVNMRSWDDTERELNRMFNTLKESTAEIQDMEDLFRIHSRLLYLYQIRNKIVGKECYIWGAGKWGNLAKIIIESLMSGIHIKAFIDGKRKQKIEEIEIINREEMEIQKDTLVFIAFAEEQEEAVRYLKERNMEVMKNIFIIA